MRRKIIIVGAGETGKNLSAKLSEGEHENSDVTVVDLDHSLLKEIQQNSNVGIVRGSCTDPKVLEEAAVSSADLFISCTKSDEINLISCMLAKNLGAKGTIAFVRNGYRRGRSLKSYKKSGVDHIINTTEQILNQIFEVSQLNKNAIEVRTFADKKVTMLSAKITEHSKLNNRKLKEIDFRGKYLIGCIVRDEIPFIPRGDDSILVNDTVYFVLPTEYLEEIKEDINLEVMNYHKAVVCGNDRFSYEVAYSLASKGLNTSIISKNTAGFREKFKKSKTVRVNHIEGSATNVSLQLKADTPNSAIFVAMMDDYENIAACMVAKHLGTGKTIAMINHSDMRSVAEMAGVDVYLSRRLHGVRYVNRLLLGKDVEHYMTVGDTPLEVITLEVDAEAKTVGKSLQEIKFPKNSLAAVITNENEPFIIPVGSTKIQAEDRIIFFTMPENHETLKDLFSGNKN